MKLALIVTSRCNARCAHCSSSCGPDKRQSLTSRDIFDLMDQAAALGAGEPLRFGITGGEPFLDFAKLLEIVAHGARLNARMTCVTNAYWASSDEKALTKLAALKDAGLGTLGVSTSRFHQRFVGRGRVERALACARQVGIRTELKVPITRSDQADGAIERWANAAGADSVSIFPVLPYLAEGEHLPAQEFIRTPGLPEGTCPSPQVTVREDGVAMTCCHPGAETGFLRLGNVFEERLGDIQDRFYLQGHQQLLRQEGPIHFARAAQAQGLGHLLRDGYADVCDLCAHISSDPRLARVADEAAAALERRQVEALFEGLLRSGCAPTARS